MISVIVPVYNTELYLRQCIDSILGQTYKDIELFLIDDGSVDNSGKICDEYAALDNRVRVIHQKNCGVSAARNTALKKVQGNWLSFIDSDDWLEPTMYEKMIEAAKNEDADIVECDLYDETEKGRKYRNYWNFSDYEQRIVLTNQDKYLYGLAYSPVLWNKIIAADLTGNSEFLEGCRYGEDTLYLSDIVCRAKRIVCMGTPLYHYRSDRSGNVVSSKINEKYMDLLYSYGLVCEKLKQIGTHNAEHAIGQLVYSACVQVIMKLRLGKEMKPYYDDLKKFCRRYRYALKEVTPNYRVSGFRLSLVKIAGFEPALCALIWQIKSFYKSIKRGKDEPTK